jgi:hypothetical protein
MMVHQTLSKGWCHARSRLLLGLIVRARGRLVEARALFGAAESRPALLSDPEVITLAILAQWPRFRSERDFWRFAWAHLRPYFPKLCSQSQLNRRVRSVEGELRDFQRATARTLCGASEVYHVLDTTLIPAIVRVRASRKGLFCGQATFGRSASKTQWVYGFKVALSVSPEGVICAFGLAEAASDDRPIGDFLIIEDPHDAYLAYPRALRAFSGSGVGWTSMELWWQPLPKTTPGGRGRKQTVAGRRESGRSSKGS